MAHNTTLDAGSGGDTIVDVDLSLNTYPTTGKLGASCLFVSVNSTTAPTPVTAVNALYIQPGTSVTFPVTDNSGSLTVDAPVGTPVFVRLSDGAAAITTLAVSLASVPSHVVTNAGVFVVQIDGAALTSLQLIDDAVSGAGFNITQMNGVNVTMGNGISGTGVQRVTLASDSTGIVSLTTSTASIGKLAANSGVDIGDVDVTSVIPGTGATSLGKAIDTATGATDTGVLLLATRDDALAALTPIDGDNVQLRTDANGALWVVHSGSLTVAQATAASLNCTEASAAAIKTAVELIDNAVSGTGFNVSQINGVAVTMGNGISGTGVQRVTIASDSTGILAGVTTVTTVTTCSTLTTLTGGGVAHDGADSGNPVKIGVKATASLLGGTPVAAADRTDLYAGTDGALIVRPGTSLEDIISERVTNTDGAATAMTGAFAATALQRIYLTDITLANSSASFITVDIRDGAAGAVLWTFPVPATGGVTHKFTTPLRFTANTALAFDASAATTTLSISVAGFKSKT